MYQRSLHITGVVSAIYPKASRAKTPVVVFSALAGLFMLYAITHRDPCVVLLATFKIMLQTVVIFGVGNLFEQAVMGGVSVNGKIEITDAGVRFTPNRVSRSFCKDVDPIWIALESVRSVELGSYWNMKFVVVTHTGGEFRFRWRIVAHTGGKFLFRRHGASAIVDEMKRHLAPSNP